MFVLTLIILVIGILILSQVFNSKTGLLSIMTMIPAMSFLIAFGFVGVAQGLILSALITIVILFADNAGILS